MLAHIIIVASYWATKPQQPQKMYFNGSPYGNHSTPHSRKLPWEKEPRVIHECSSPSFELLGSLNQKLSPATVSGTSTFEDHLRRLEFEADDMLDSDTMDRQEDDYKRHLHLHLQQQAMYQANHHIHKSLTESAKLNYKKQENVRAKEHRSRNGMTLRTKLRASAYTAGGTDYRKLFRFLDTDNSGFLNFSEFLALCRKSGKIVRTQVTDQEIEDLFKEEVDADGNGEISIEEFIAWIESEPKRSGRRSERLGDITLQASPEIGKGQRTQRQKIGELVVGIGKKAGSNHPEKRITIIIRDGDDPGVIVNRLRRKYKLLKGQGDAIVNNIREILTEYHSLEGKNLGGKILRRNTIKFLGGSIKRIRAVDGRRKSDVRESKNTGLTEQQQQQFHQSQELVSPPDSPTFLGSAPSVPPPAQRLTSPAAHLKPESVSAPKELQPRIEENEMMATIQELRRKLIKKESENAGLKAQIRHLEETVTNLMESRASR